MIIVNTVATRDIRVHLKELIKSSGERQSTVASKIGISEGYLSKFLNGKEINFWMVREIVRYLDLGNEAALMKRYCLSGIKKKNFAVALEYCYSKQMFDVIEVLTRERLHMDKEREEWANIYLWILKSRGAFNQFEYTEELKCFTPYSTEMKTLLYILEMYGYFYNNRFDMTIYYIETVRKMIESIDDPFLKIAFSARIDEVSANIYLKQKNDLIKARELAERLLKRNLSVNHNITAFYILALSYMTESYSKSIYYYSKCIKLYEQFPDRADEMVQNKEEIAILQHYWNKEISEEYKVTKFVEFLSENKSLESFYSDNYYNKYALLFDGIKERSSEKLLLSLHYFSEKRDYFRANFPKIDLIKNGFNFKL
ncbi:HTH cro/C1-type domain-containing protein [Bacillus subtilis]